MNGVVLDFEKPVVELEKKIAELRELAEKEPLDFSNEIRELEKKLTAVQEKVFQSLTAWQRTQLARHPNRPYTLDYIRLLMEDFVELAGDRYYGEDKAIIGGVARFEGRPVIVIGHQKGRDTKENLMRNFGMAHPEGYRKALRLMKLGEKFGHPVITFIDTPGAYPGIGAEERGQARAIADNLFEMSLLKVPIIAVVIGEGGSGGALGVGQANRILILQNAVYFVCSPEACGAILWNDRTRAPEAAESLRITADKLLQAGVADEIIPEPPGGAHRNFELTAGNIRHALQKNLERLCNHSSDELINLRYQKYRRIGQFRDV